MGVRTARLPENLEEYLKILIQKGYASSYGNAINLIILDRMMSDKEKRTVTPFKYRLKDARRIEAKDISDIETENIEEPAAFPLGEAPPIAGPSPAPSGGLSLSSESENKVSSVRSEKKPGDVYRFGISDKPVFPGTKEQYEEALRLRTISKDAFRPPE